MKTVKVRIAVAVDQSGAWYGCGGNSLNGSSTEEIVRECVGAGERVCWLTAELPVPEPAEVAATVEEAKP